jgi:antitoxin component YwqK of YwqJK toxin-antitoxin module
MKLLLIAAAFTGALATQAQPDTLYVPQGDSTYAYAVVYDPVMVTEQYKLIGHYAHLPERVAVEMGHKRGRPSGVYRAFYPDGRPLIFAVYGWGSPHGDWTEYDEVGRVTIKGQYRDGQRDGVWAFRRLGIVGHYRKGEMHGKWKTYENGKLARVSKYRRGKLLKGSEYHMP